MRRYGLAFLLACSTAAVAHAQVPFDMSPERPVQEDQTTAPELPTPPSATPRQPSSPRAMAPREYRRLLLPTGDLTLRGEMASRSWVVHLTEAQAQAPATFHLAYSNAVVVAPESSQLQFLINDVVVAETPIRGSEGGAQLTADVPADLLRTGRNQVTVRISQRHRTDCTIESTYELWTGISSEGTYLSFADEAATRLSGLEDLRSIAPDASGKVKIAVIAPGMARGDFSADIMKLTQAIALYAALPNLEYVIDSSPTAEQEDAALRVLLGTNAELSSVAQELPAAAAAGPFTAFAPTADGTPTLVVSGRDRAEWLAALEQLAAPVNREAGRQRESIVTEAWRLPNAPMIYGRRDIPFSELGVRSEQFSGRVFSTSFQFAVPADFYAASYGEARILLDAIYSEDVLPGSLINIYVNGSIAVSIPLSTQGGAIMEQLPVPLTMRHFKPGLNNVDVVANLLTAEDQACPVVTRVDAKPRFALYGTSRLVVPDFARIAQRPNLRALAGTGYPYGLKSDPTPIFLERSDAPMLSVAADLLGRMAQTAGRTVPVSFTTSVDATAQQDAIFIGAINSIPPSVLSQVNVAEESRRSWIPANSNAPSGANPVQADAESWRQQMEQQTWLSRLEDWFIRSFDLSFSALRFTPEEEAAYMPRQSSTILLAQGQNPADNGVWTLVSASDIESLRQGATALTAVSNWDRIAGRLVTLESDLETIDTIPATSVSLVQTKAPSLSNFRLIVANWLSSNILSYALLLVAACVGLGVVTTALLSRLGRRQ